MFRSAILATSLTAACAVVGQSLTLLTYLNVADTRLAYLLVSAQRHGIYPLLLGVGEPGSWPMGGHRLNAYRRFLLGPVADEELVLMVDAVDVLVFAGPGEIVSRFTEMEARVNRSVFFNAEFPCYPNLPDICTPQYPRTKHGRHLNAGMLIGRAAALREMLRGPIANDLPENDQGWCHRYYIRHTDRVALDEDGELLSSYSGDMRLVGRRLENPATGVQPALVHMVSHSHWPRKAKGVWTDTVYEIFTQLYPKESDEVFGLASVAYQIGGHHRGTFSFRGAGRRAAVRVLEAMICLRCRVWGFGYPAECQEATSWTSAICADLVGALAVLAVLLAAVLVACCRCLCEPDWRPFGVGSISQYYCFDRLGRLLRRRPTGGTLPDLKYF